MTKARQLTVAAINRIRPPDSGRAEHFDSVVPGLALRVTENGKKSWSYLYRIDGRQRRLTLGPYPAIALDEARQRARDARLLIDRGEDPVFALAQHKAEMARDRRATFASVAESFLETYRRKKNAPQTIAQSESLLRRQVLPRWADLPIDKIRRRDVVALLDSIADDGQPFVGVNVHKELRTLFNWAVDRELIEANPIGRYVVPVRQASRTRVLSDIEIAAIWNACIELGYPFGSLTRMLLLTAQRRTETARMKWDYLDLDQRLWTIPAELTKSDRTQTVPISPAALDIVQGLPRHTGPYMFSTTGGEKPVSGYSKAKRRLDEASGVSDWRLHDLRRTAATGMIRLGVASQVLSRILNHGPERFERATDIYNRHGYDDEKRAALDAWAEHVGEFESSTSPTLPDLVDDKWLA